ncbi:hypothetical protein M1D47_21120 [Bacillus sp. R1-10]
MFENDNVVRLDIEPECIRQNQSEFPLIFKTFRNWSQSLSSFEKGNISNRGAE